MPWPERASIATPTLLMPSSHAYEKGEHYHRQVVYAVIPGIFEEMQGDRFARAGEAANENEFHHPEHNEGGVHNQPAA